MEKSYRRKVVYLGLKCKCAKVLHRQIKKIKPQFSDDRSDFYEV